MWCDTLWETLEETLEETLMWISLFCVGTVCGLYILVWHRSIRGQMPFPTPPDPFEIEHGTSLIWKIYALPIATPQHPR